MTNALQAPPTTASIISMLRSEGSLHIFLRALEASGLAPLLEGPLTFTVFAPSDEALRFGPQEELLAGSSSRLEKIVAFHVVPGIFRGTCFNEKATLKTIAGRDLAIDRSHFVEPDIKCANGIIHIIDGLLRPAW